MDDVRLVVSELVTNACNAHADDVSLAVEGHHTHALVYATDDAGGLPVRQQPMTDSLNGRGLLIVDAVSTRWGVTYNNGTKTVWADVPWTAEVEATFECSD